MVSGLGPENRRFDPYMTEEKSNRRWSAEMVDITVQSRVHQERKCTDLRMFGESLKPPPFMGFGELGEFGRSQRS